MKDGRHRPDRKAREIEKGAFPMKTNFAQLSLFSEAAEQKARSQKLDKTVDALRTKYGRATIQRGALLKDSHEVGKKYKAQMETETSNSGQKEHKPQGNV